MHLCHRFRFLRSTRTPWVLLLSVRRVCHWCRLRALILFYNLLNLLDHDCVFLPDQVESQTSLNVHKVLSQMVGHIGIKLDERMKS